MILITWGWLYKPQEAQQKKGIKTIITQNNRIKTSIPSKKLLERGVAIDSSKEYRIAILNNKITGSLYLKGAKFDDLTLLRYYKTINKEKNINLLSPSPSSTRYLADFGWVSSDKSTELPNHNTLWKSNKKP